MKNFKLVAAIAAAAILVVGASMTSFAATGWQEENGVWKYYDKNGDAVSGEWKKSGENWFYLNDEGEMAVDQLIEWNDNYYYVDANGAMVTNAWKFVADEEGEENWYYFQNSGKAYKKGDSLSWKTINGKKYAFAEDGKMLYGWVSADGEQINDDENDAYKTGLYYCGSIEDGSRRNSCWEYLAVADDKDSEFAWFWFNGTGKKEADNDQKKVNGKWYGFDEFGKMFTGWNGADATEASPASYHLYAGIEDGSEARGQWIRKIPGENVKSNNDDYNSDTAHWYYANKDGSLKKSELAKINGKYYAFNDNAEMISGLYYVTFVNNSNKIDAVKVDKKDDAAYPRQSIETYKDLAWIAAGNDIRDGLYFFGDEETDGSMKTGTITVTVADDDYSMLFATTGYKGKGFNGYKNKIAYTNGIKVAASGDDVYKAYKTDSKGNITEALDARDIISDHEIKNDKKEVIGFGDKSGLASNKWVLLTKSGSKVTSGTKKDGNDYRFKVVNGYVDGLWMEY